MNRQQGRQPRPLASEPSQGRVDSPYLTAKETAAYLRFASVRALYKAVGPQQIPVRYRGKTLLFHKGDLDRWLAGERSADLRLAARHGHESSCLSVVTKGDPVSR